MKSLKRFSSILVAMLTLCCLAQAVLAANPGPLDPDRETSLTVRLRSLEDEVKDEEGAEVTIYKVADMTEVNGEIRFEYTSAFAECKEDLSKEIPLSAIQAMESMAKQNGAPAISKTTDENGRAFFTDLDQAVYLVAQTRSVTGFTTFEPFLSYLPSIEEGAWNYDVMAKPKIVYSILPGRKPTPTPTPTPPTTPTPTPPPGATPTPPPGATPTPPPGTTPDPKLPQTGQTNWPIPVLLISGLMFVSAGLIVKYTRKHHEDA